ncbi:hypothetical protein N8I74_07260 [Chitiniphilus purpureus]|uniref:Type II secretion system protein GspC N-terminal domain-containing protein n=1 Tax=Chitiniphilus purpureus TaxID=2981137 RepID=A0ABY6DR09_9NEIS|nr:hypothetical protein [Chitiniphilus sp. CD1]UXY16809.1 hypothetical protein N8I74_07260 [Chitiniphilus sp. CD1]
MLSRPVLALLAGALLLMAYAWYQEQQASEEAAAAPRRAATGQIGQPVPSPTPARSAEPAATEASQAQGFNLFAQQTWAPPPPPPPPPAKPTPTPVPVAPPLPFVVVGSWHERGADQIIIEANGQQFVLCRRCEALGRIQPGETLLGVYRVDDITRDAITLTFMPLNQQQTLPVGGTP